MTYNYVSTFRIDPGTDENPPVGFLADTDTNQAGEGPIFGDMKPSETAGIINNDWAEGGGFTVAFMNDSGQPASENFYVVDPLKDLGPTAFNILNSAPNLMAQLLFDSPQSMMADGQPNTGTPWTVALNFKTGDENDLPTDSRIGARFTFIGGAARFRGAGPEQMKPGTYADFAATTFRLIVSIQRTETTFQSGALGNVGETEFPGIPAVNTDPTVLKFGLSLAAARNAGAKITAVGVLRR